MLQFLYAAKQPIRLERLAAHHPCLFGALLLVGLPVAVLLAMSLLLFVMAVPMTLLFG